MHNHDSFIGTPVIEEAIDYNPLIVTPETLLEDAIALMSQARGKSCSLNNGNGAAAEINDDYRVASCVLVMEGSELLGIFTERDIVWLSADGRDFQKVKIGEVMAQPVITLNQGNFQDIFAALFLFRRYRIRHLPIVDKEGKPVGVVCPESIRRVLKPANLLKLRRVNEVMTKQVVHVPLTVSVLQIARLMAEYQVSCIVLTEECVDSVFLPVGIITERDIVQFQSLELKLANISAQEVMSTPLFLLTPEDSLWTAHQEMQQRRVRRLVVSWNWGLGLGIVTQTSLLRVFDPMEMYEVIETLQRTIQQLEVRKNRDLSAQASQFSELTKEPKVEFKERGKLECCCLTQSWQSFEAIYSNEIYSNETQPYDLKTVLSRVQVSLESLINQPETVPELRQHELQKVLEDIKILHQLI